MDGLARRESARRFLDAHQTVAIAHPGGTLLDHLLRTEAQLKEWDVGDDLTLAGLCHATYGTDGFARALIDPSARVELVATIGSASEAIVYRYASCDRSVLYAELGVVANPQFRDRFTGEHMALGVPESRAFVTLTVANELDVMRANPTLAAQHGPALATLFARCEHLMPFAAVDAYRTVLGSGLRGSHLVAELPHDAINGDADAAGTR